MMSVQGVDLDANARRVWRDGIEIRMSNKEFDLLHALISRPGEIVTREELMRDVWQTNFWTSAKTIDVHLGWVRKKLGHDDPGPRPALRGHAAGVRRRAGPGLQRHPDRQDRFLTVLTRLTRLTQRARRVVTLVA